jgi:hypothetical protein
VFIFGFLCSFSVLYFFLFFFFSFLFSLRFPCLSFTLETGQVCLVSVGVFGPLFTSSLLVCFFFFFLCLLSSFFFLFSDAQKLVVRLPSVSFVSAFPFSLLSFLCFGQAFAFTLLCFVFIFGFYYFYFFSFLFFPFLFFPFLFSFLFVSFVFPLLSLFSGLSCVRSSILCSFFCVYAVKFVFIYEFFFFLLFRLFIYFSSFSVLPSPRFSVRWTGQVYRLLCLVVVVFELVLALSSFLRLCPFSFSFFFFLLCPKIGHQSFFYLYYFIYLFGSFSVVFPTFRSSLLSVIVLSFPFVVRHLHSVCCVSSLNLCSFLGLLLFFIFFFFFFFFFSVSFLSVLASFSLSFHCFLSLLCACIRPGICVRSFVFAL